MKKRPNDRIGRISLNKSDQIPKIYMTVNDQEFVKPGIETYFAKTPEQKSKAASSGCSCNPFAGTVCSCNRVCSCNAVCSCQSHTVQSTVTKSTESTKKITSRTPIKTCSCVGYTRSRSSSRSGSYCSCVPVH